MSISGSCLCGAVTYTATGALRPVIACHCQQCRKVSGHYGAATGALRENVEISGEVTWYQSSPTARRGFCGICGSSLFWDGAGSHLSIWAGTIDGATGLAVAGHIYCADKGDYYEIPEGVQRAEQDDPTLTTMVTS